MTGLMLVALLAAPDLSAQIPCGKGVRKSPCMPSVTERDDLMKLIDTAIKEYEELGRAQAREQEFRLLIKERHSSDYRNWHDALVLMEESEDLLRETFARLLSQTERAYGVGPRRKAGTIQGGHLVGSSATWSPTIRDDRFLYDVRRPGKPTVYLRYSNAPDEAGATLDDGRVVIALETLRRAQKNGSPAILAAVIDHEGDHFEKLVGKGGWNGRDSVEASAYARELETAKAIGLEGDDVGDLRRLHAGHYSRSLPRELVGSLRGGGYEAAPHSGDYPYVLRPESHYKEWKGYQSRLEQIRTERDELNRRLAEGGRTPDPWRDALNERRPPPEDATMHNGCGGGGWWAGDVYMPPVPCPGRMYSPPPPPPAPVRAAPTVPPAVAAPVQPPARVQADAVVYLTAWAREACAQPPTLSQSSLDGWWPHLGWVAYDEGLAGALSGCERTAFLLMLRWRSQGVTRVPLETLMAELRPAPTPYGGPEVDDSPGPRGPEVPECLQREGGRCIRWR